MERKAWREKIRIISIEIQQCKYMETDKKRLEENIAKLEMYINPYGKAGKVKYLEDGHIWNVIENVREAENEEEFEKNKKLLLDFLKLLLKEDWERSKREVKGYWNIVCCSAITCIIIALYAIIYFGILKLHNVVNFMIVPVISIGLPLFIREYFIESIKKLVKERKDIKNNTWLKIKWKENKIIIISVTVIFLIVFTNSLITIYFWSLKASEQMKYYSDEEIVYVYTELNSNMLYEFERNLEQTVEKDVEIINKMDIIPEGVGYDESNDLFAEGIRKSMEWWNGIVIVISLWGMFFQFNILCEDYMKIRKYEKEIERLNYCACTRYDEDYKELIKILKLINLTDKNYKEYLGLANKILFELERYLRNELEQQEQTICSLEEYERAKANQKKVENVKKGIKQVKRLGRTIRIKTRKKRLAEIIKTIEEVS